MRVSGETVYVACDTHGKVRGVFSSREAAEAFLAPLVHPILLAQRVYLYIIDEP